jgi:hypothetical protein
MIRQTFAFVKSYGKDSRASGKYSVIKIADNSRKTRDIEAHKTSAPDDTENPGALNVSFPRVPIVGRARRYK